MSDGDERDQVPDLVMLGLAAQASHARQHDQNRMRMEATYASWRRMLTSELTVDQLMTLRHMFGFLNSKMANYLEGMIVMSLYGIHKVNPETGKTLEEELINDPPPVNEQ